MLVEKPEEKKPLGRPRCRCENNKNISFRKRVGEVEWIDVAQIGLRSLLNTVMNL
jgi:hypothetical protein